MRIFGPRDDPGDDVLRAARMRAARANRLWTELDPVDLVEREHGLFVSAETDRVFRRHPGSIFATASSTLVADQTAGLFFTVDASGSVEFFEQVPNTTWTAILERRARRGRVRA